MRVVEIPDEAHQLIALARETQERRNQRLDGLHVSDLIHCAVRGWYRTHGAVERDKSDEVSLMLLSGHALHALIERDEEEGRLVWTTPSGHVVHGTVDLPLVTPDGEAYPGELKSTRISARQRIPVKAPQYLEQVATYALIMQTLRGRLHVMHLLGDYTGFKGPQMRSYDVEFREGEMEAWRQELDRRAQLIVADERPDLSEHHYSECELCPFHVDAGGPCEGGEGEWRLFFHEENKPRVEI